MPLVIPIEGAVETVIKPLGVLSQSGVLAGEVETSSPMASANLIGPALNIVSQNGLISDINEYAAYNAGALGQFSETIVPQSANVAAGDSFLVLADLLEADIADATTEGPGGFFKSQELNGRLLVNGVEIDIKGFQYQAPTGRLGALLNVQLAKADVSQVPIGASIDFDITIVTANGTSYRRLIANGKLSGRDYTMTYRGGANGGPSDEVSFGALDVITDKFSLAPRRPVVMYNPAKVRYTDVKIRARDAVTDEAGKAIMPVIEAVNGLTMRQILKRAYTDVGGYDFTTPMTIDELAVLSSQVTALMSNPSLDQKGLGFANVITNIPDYKVSRADFTIESGWHSGAQPCVGMFGPLYYVESNILYIIDVEFSLPAGHEPRTIYFDKRLSETVPFKPDANAVLLTYQLSAEYNDGLLERTIIETPTVDVAGTFGVAGYTETTTRNTVVEKYYADAPDEVVSSYIKSYVVETRSQLPIYDHLSGTVSGVSGLKLTHRETHQDFYLGDLKTGHDKIVEGLIVDGPDASLVLRELIREKCNVTWIDDPVVPGQKIQERSHTETTGLCYVDTEGPEITRINNITGEPEQAKLWVPALVAQASGIINANTFVNSLIKRQVENLRHLHGNQYDVSVIEIDYLTGTVKRSTSAPRTGSTSADPYNVRSKTMLIRDRDSEADIGPRIPVTVNSGELPRDRAIALGYRALNRLKNPLFENAYDLLGVDFAVQRGSIVRGVTRTGYTGNYFIRGFAIAGVNLGRKGHRVSMTLDATELPPTS